jgi:hypothetical protein
LVSGAEGEQEGESAREWDLAARCQASRHGDHIGFRDSHIEKTLRVPARKVDRACGVRKVRIQHDHVGTAIAEFSKR